MVEHHRLLGGVGCCGYFYSPVCHTQLLDSVLCKIVYNSLSISNKKAKTKDTQTFPEEIKLLGKSQLQDLLVKMPLDH